jgi:SAM-dependent methyltransferase
MIKAKNVDAKTVAGFGDEWLRFDQSALSAKEQQTLFNSYFSIFPWKNLRAGAVGFDLGCGSGRWAQLVAPQVGRLHCIDPSAALEVAKSNLQNLDNCEFHNATVDAIPLADESMDFGYSLGVLHHVPDTAAGLQACVKKLKIGAPFLLYLYYAFDDRPLWFKAIWHCSDFLRGFISRLPHGPRYWVSQGLAMLIYFPLARTAALAETLGINVKHFPLSAYRHLSFYTMRTDALDRFGTRLEQRFSRDQITEMMKQAGLDQIEFSNQEPYWCAVGRRAK